MLSSMSSAGLCGTLYFNITWGGAVWVKISIIDLALHCFLFSRSLIKRVSWLFVVTLPEMMALHGKAKKYKAN